MLSDVAFFRSLIVPHLDLVIEMIEKNIFRPLPVLKKIEHGGEMSAIEEDE